MNFKEIIELIEKVAEHGIASVEIERAGTRVRIEGKPSRPQAIESPGGEPRAGAPASQPAAGVPGSAAALAAARQEAEESEAGLHIITSPIVGIFYRAPNPELEAFVNVGDRVAKGKVLCIIEAMKLMNEIECDADGTLVKIYPQNGQPVEYGEKLFAIRA
ncbi:MAG TPA: acetyl-CoA carboxylase biotin carboxyl carrier protein [Thermoanaerobaculia bacterium]|nr:acetyl-CoA carboxylase biotin carboxyl carrier protein [Thermoanaerobaculia bacterium]